MSIKSLALIIVVNLSSMYTSCAPKNIVGTYSKKLGNSNYYEFLSLAPDGRFNYTSNDYVQANDVPYMPVFSAPPDSKEIFKK